MNEKLLQNSVVQYLECLGGFVRSIKSGKLLASYGGKTRMIHPAQKGTPDLHVDLSMKQNGANCHGYIDHRGAVAMSELLLNWKGGIEFLLNGVQQTMF